MRRCLALSLAVAAFAAHAASEARQADPPLVVNGDVTLTTNDFLAYAEKVPDQLRDDFRASTERVKKTVDGLWVQRNVALKARAAGLAEDPIVAARLRQAQELVLVDVYLRDLEKRMKYPDLVPRAREIYNAHPDRFKAPGKVHLQHILVDTKCRTPDAARKRALELRAEAVAPGADFLAVAKRSSDDPQKDKNSGDLGPMLPTEFDESFRKAIAPLNKPGQVSEPLETRFGFHIVRMVKREPERLRTFDEVKDEIVKAEKQKLLDEARTEVLLSVRNDPNTRLHLENVEALVEKRPTAGLPGTQPKAR